MDVEKAASKGHGFFGLFDWGKSKKSKRRLFSGSGGVSPAPGNTVHGKEVDGSAPSTPSNSILEDASEHSCSSSVIDDEARVRRGPTVVARLMGLDSMPMASSTESYAMPSTVQQTFQNNVHDEFIGRSYFSSPSPHKMPSSPIDRFRMEALPPRFPKRTLSVAQHKLFSPVKNPTHISRRNAADIMEAASRIIGPGVENTSAYRVRDVGYSNDVRAFNPTEIARVQQMSQAAKKRDGLASLKSQSANSLDGSLITSETTSSSRVSQSNGGAPVGPKVKAGSRSSPDLRGTHVHGREGISNNSRKLATRTDPEHNMVERNGCNQQKSNNQVGRASSSNVLVQNNRKQNAMCVEHKVNSKTATLSQQRSNLHSTNAAPKKAAVTSTHAGNSTKGNKKAELQPTKYANRRVNSAAKTIPKPRRLPDGRMHSKKSQSSDKILADRSPRRVRHNIVIEEQSSFSTNKKKISTEIVSFTFTSPVDKLKPLPGSHFPNHSVETRSIENVNAVSTSSNTSNAESDIIDGDYLRLLLDQKLKELTSGVRSPYCKPDKGVRIYTPSPVLDDMASTCDTSSIASTDCDRDSIQSFKDGKAKLPLTDVASKSGQSSQSGKYDNDFIDQVELEHLHLSPHSAWEASLSTETCSSAESWRNTNNSRFSSTEGAPTSAHDGRLLEADALSEYSDTASSIIVTTAEINPSESSSLCHMDRRQEIHFLREILNSTSLTCCHPCSLLERFGRSDILDPHLLEELNGKCRLAVGEEEGKTFRMIRRLLFDCTNEMLSLKCAYYFNAGYNSWFMGMAVLQKLSPEEIYQEMNSLKVAEEWMVDELVYREMSGPLGSWVDFKMESYEAAKDVTAELLGSLIDEMVADLLYW
ncbi:uncharacterized protein LOC100823037 [Brachypodium distachyon]|nr:uncharacterized protein LOC100823037 [Brachypodium distachyon]KQK12329.1 hypothetical protein BRADI_1g02980v3 [Brachypodium distachyon]PNT73853.1 hypothetical protein BRADI_1g02980v3 [Brachypodium distachyon]PNT73854.1 hypothetical protein BRADI_1g02980v3 [Brachypodium distachyon]|eukprot:XP_003563274.1 uncharacterized protein LOC100823037 [Brachypodium distachyon]